MKKHGPAFRKAVIELGKCPLCRGRAVTMGTFYELPCDHCNASGFVVAATGEALALDELVTQLSMALRAAHRQIDQLKNPRATGPGAQYQEGNRLGAGGSNYTGD